MPASRDTPAPEHCRPGGVRDSHTRSSLSLRASPLLSASNLCSEPVPPRASEILCLPSPPRLPHPRVGFVTGRSGDRFLVQPGLRRRGHRAAFGNPGGGLLGWIAALGNRGAAPGLWGRPALSRLRLPSPPMHPGKCSPLNAGSVKELAQPGHKSQDSSRPEGAAVRPLPTAPAFLPPSRGSRTWGDPFASARRPLLTEVAGPRARVRLHLWKEQWRWNRDHLHRPPQEFSSAPIPESYYSRYKSRFISHFSFLFYSNGFCSVKLQVCQV